MRTLRAFLDCWRCGVGNIRVITRRQSSNSRFRTAATLRRTRAKSAIIANFPPGDYTAIVRGVNNTTGVALVEVYDLH
jgi:hypothetical protein